MKPTLQFRLSQHLTLTPQLQQAIRLLQLSTVELDQEIERLLAENPVLERADGEAEEDASNERARAEAPARGGEAEERTRAEELPADYGTSWPRGDEDEDGERTFSLPATPTLRDHLVAQLGLTNLGLHDRALLGLLIDALDDDGYLTQSLEEIAALLPPEVDAGVDELAIALRHLQNMEPVGVGARSPGECLALQLRARGADDASSRLALAIAEHHLELLAARDYVRLRAATGAGDDELRAAQQLIRGLDPRPGAAFAKLEARYVIADVIVRKVKGAWRVALNPEAIPKLRIHRLYAQLAADRANGSPGLGTQLQEARWLIKNVQQRFDTILRVAQAIVERQRHFLEHGDVAMRPMVLREIAGALGLHESTISRVTTQKYMATPRGTFELKYFFGSHVATDSGGAASGKAIRALIRQLVAAESGLTPLSDASISQILAQQGIVVARRTVAKYREALQIRPAHQRKSL
jgi:RNA polymerase sigma-54 factor